MKPLAAAAVLLIAATGCAATSSATDTTLTETSVGASSDVTSLGEISSASVSEPSASISPVSATSSQGQAQEILNIDEASDALGAGYSGCFVLQPYGPRVGAEDVHATSPLVNGEMDGLSLDPGIPFRDYACLSGVMIINIVFFDSVYGRTLGLADIGHVYGTAMKNQGVTELALAWDDNGVWIAWVEKAGQPMSAPPTNVVMSLIPIADALGGTYYSIEP